MKKLAAVLPIGGAGADSKYATIARLERELADEKRKALL